MSKLLSPQNWLQKQHILVYNFCAIGAAVVTMAQIPHSEANEYFSKVQHWQARQDGFTVLYSLISHLYIDSMWKDLAVCGKEKTNIFVLKIFFLMLCWTLVLHQNVSDLGLKSK